jgi:hypothetical protein
MYVSPQDYLDPVAMGSSYGSEFGSDLGNELAGGSSLLGTAQGDDVARFQPPTANGSLGSAASTAMQFSPYSMLAPLLGGMGSMLQNIGNFFGGGMQPQTPAPAQPTQTAPSMQAPSQQQYFGNATASSTGDPHLAFNGTNSAGATDNAHWDSMSSHHDLLDSDSFSGGYRVSTQASSPNANGVTYNQSASVTTNNGADRVSLDANGNATIAGNGQSCSIADGQSLSLGNGETVSRAQNGTLTIDDTNSNGGSIATTLSENGNGVDVNVQAGNVDLGGALANGPGASPSQGQPPWMPQPFVPQPYNQPSRRYPMDEGPAEISAAD